MAPIGNRELGVDMIPRRRFTPKGADWFLVGSPLCIPPSIDMESDAFRTLFASLCLSFLIYTSFLSFVLCGLWGIGNLEQSGVFICQVNMDSRPSFGSACNEQTLGNHWYPYHWLLQLLVAFLHSDRQRKYGESLTLHSEYNFYQLFVLVAATTFTFPPSSSNFVSKPISLNAGCCTASISFNPSTKL